MLTVVILAVSVIIGTIAFWVAKKTATPEIAEGAGASTRPLWMEARERATRRAAYVVSALAATVAIVVTVTGTVVIISATEVGVPTTLGSIGGPMASGVHVKALWTDVETYPIRPETARDVTVLVRTAQSGSFTVELGARWSVNPKNARETYMQVRTGDKDKISKDIVDRLLKMAGGNVYARYQNLDAANNREAAEKDLKAELSRLIAPYGINIDGAFVLKSEPDAVTSASIAQFTSQQNATKVAVEATKTAEQQALQRLAEANGLRNAANALPSNLTPTSLQALCLQAWERQADSAIKHGVPLYTAPCGPASSLPVTVAAK